jgi:gas vesicle protein
MKAATSNELKQELQSSTSKQLVELCLRLARFKKENKELLTYLLFEAHDETSYIQSVKNDMDEQFAQLSHANLYLTKKSLRKILRNTNKYIRYTGSKLAETELIIHYCQNIQSAAIPIHKSTALTNLFQQQLKKIKTAVSALHEDLQHDYLKEVDKLKSFSAKH